MFTFQATVLKCGVLFGKLFIIYWMLVKSAKCKHNNSKIMSAVPKNTVTWGMNTTIVNITILHMKYVNSIKDSPQIFSEV